jgi:hypothetical protein
MDGITSTTGGSDVDAALVQIAKVRETAGHLAKDGAPRDADPFGLLVGLIHQLAEQMEHMVATVRPPIPGAEGYPEEATAAPLGDLAR